MPAGDETAGRRWNTYESPSAGWIALLAERCVLSVGNEDLGEEDDDIFG